MAFIWFEIEGHQGKEGRVSLGDVDNVYALKKAVKAKIGSTFPTFFKELHLDILDLDKFVLKSKLKTEADTQAQQLPNSKETISEIHARYTVGPTGKHRGRISEIRKYFANHFSLLVSVPGKQS